ncbi:MAG: hypothetical protein AAGI63_03290 [Planctomycetota bacterium]
MVFRSNRIFVTAVLLWMLSPTLQDCHGQDRDPSPAARSARELLKRVESQNWGEGLHRIEYVARYLQNGVPAVANCRLEQYPERKLALWRINRIDPSENGLTHVYLRSADGVFHLKRTSPKDAWTLVGYGYRKPVPDGGLIPSVPDSGERIDREYQLIATRPRALMLGKMVKSLVDDFDLSFGDANEEMPTILGELRSGKTPQHGIESFELMIDPKSFAIRRFEFVSKHSVKVKGLLRPLPKVRAGDTEGFHWMQTATSDNFSPHMTEIKITALAKHSSDDELAEFFLPYYGLTVPKDDKQ